MDAIALRTLFLVFFLVCSCCYSIPEINCDDDIHKQADYHYKFSDQLQNVKPTEFVLIRILSNDLPPRHKQGQTVENLQFMLKHEVPFPDCTNLWLVNRVFNKTQEAEVIKVLDDYKQRYQVIPFDLEAWLNRYKKKGYLYSTSYATEVNFARNTAIAEAKKLGFRYILAWDGNEYFTLRDYNQIREKIYLLPKCKNFLVPIVRVPGDNDKFLLQPNSHTWEKFGEPQLIVRNDSTLKYDLKMAYGAESKNYLVRRLRFKDPNCTANIGQVYRLYSGAGKAGEHESRGKERATATVLFHGWLYTRATKCLGFEESDEARNGRLGNQFRLGAKMARGLGFTEILDFGTLAERPPPEI